MTDFNLMEFLPYRLSVLSDRLSSELAKRRAQHGLTTAEWRVMAHLSQSDAVSIRDIQKKVAMEKPKVSRAASQLEASGLITKKEHASDGRLLELSLTSKGRKMMDDIIPSAEEFQAQLEAELGPDLAPLNTAITKLMDAKL